MSTLKREDYTMQLRESLRVEGIKLWLEPYYLQSTGPSIPQLKTLSEKYSTSLKIPYDDTYSILLELQTTAVENLKQRNRFQQSGLATLKIKIVSSGNRPKIITKELMLSMRTCDLKNLIISEVATSPESLKLISAGKVLNDVDSLATQGVKNGQQVLALVMSETPTSVQESENQIKELQDVKTDSQLLALDSDYMHIEDQFGNAIRIPPNEKKSLIVAMTLHEKGKSALKKNCYTRALVFLIEADEEYKHCNSQLLKTVDNYALLDLDIAWCYLCLETVQNLPEASERLKRCEERLNKSYGPNLERVLALKGTQGPEAVLYLRLHLLQGIVMYHQNQRKSSLDLLKKTQKELENLKVKEEDVVTLVELGFNIIEARLGLRATYGDLNRAVEYINEMREKREESRRKAKAEEILEKESKQLGKCADGKQFVNPQFLKMLVNMGYNKEAARVALQKCNNIISDSIQYIQENPLPGPSTTRSEEMLSLIMDMVPRLVEAGFSTEMARLALIKHSGDIARAAEDMIANGGTVECDPALIEQMERAGAGASSSSSTSTSSSSTSSKFKKSDPKKDAEKLAAEAEKKDQAFKRLRRDISMVDDDYLDFSLDQEEEFLMRYLSLFD